MDPSGNNCHQPPNIWPAQHYQMQMRSPWVLPSSGFWDPSIPPPPYVPPLTTSVDANRQRWNPPVNSSWVNHSVSAVHELVASRNFPGETEIPAVHQREFDQSFVDNFFSARPNYSAKKKPTGVLQIPDVRVVLKKCLRHIEELKELHESLKDTVDGKDSTWVSMQQRAIFLQSQVKSSLGDISSHEQLLTLKAKLKKITKKRDRLKRQKLHRMEAKIEQEKRNKMVHEKLDAWLQSIRQKYLDEQMEKKMKREADSILCEVRRKKAEATRTLALVKSVEKLRLAKKRSSEAKGQFTTSESDSRFADAVARFESNLSARLFEYGEEERTLQAMLDEERRETRDAEERRRLREHDDRVDVVRREIMTSLFGPEAAIDERDSRFYFWELYTRAERDLEALVHIRRDWDVWLVRTDTERTSMTSSSVPIGWVMPSDPSSEAWAAVLGKRQ